MRGGEDELMAPVNTRRPQRKRTMSTNALAMRKTVFGQPGGEFWKRFNVMAKLDTNKERCVNSVSIDLTFDRSCIQAMLIN